MLTIYGVPISVHTRKVIVTARLKGLDYENDPVIPFDPPERWRALSPTSLIPAIRHDDFELADSSAICAYLERVAPTPAIYPAGSRAAGRALWFERYATDVLFHKVVHPLFHQKIIRPHILQEGPPNDAELWRIAEEVAPGIFEYLESQIMDEYFVGDSLSIADIAIVANLINYQYLGFQIDNRCTPKLAEIFMRIVQLPGFRDALAAEAPFAAQMGLDQHLLVA